MAGGARSYRGVGADERRAQRRDRLIQAALDEVGEVGVEGVTMTAICRRARLTERYFYESFQDREDLLAATFDACLVELDEALFVALDRSPADLLERGRAAAAAMIDVLARDPRKARLHAESAGSVALRERRADAIGAHADLLASEIRTLRSLRVAIDDPRLRLGTLVLMAGMAEAVVSWLDGTLALSREELSEQCARLAVATADAVAVSLGA
jgi:AcrR family transcriptional regulator